MDMTDLADRFRIRAHVNRTFVKKAGADDAPRSADYYQGKADAFDTAAELAGQSS